jgi:L-ascorbate metabolism protein UlaG (beta-lactamase superfamily)
MSKTFGRLPKGARLERVQQSFNYKNGSFQNLTPTQALREDASFCKMIKDFTNKPKTVRPAAPFTIQRHDIAGMKAPSIVWFGHSSYLLKLQDLTIIVDPVFSGHAAPVKFFGKSFEGTDIFDVNDLGNIDYALITHDHYDHMDYETILKLNQKVKHFYTSLGVGSHLEYWGIPADKITELDWWESATINEQATITAAPARHFSGRGVKRAQTLWSSFILKTSQENLYLGGDSGYDTHFKTIGEQYGPFDLAILECGQYGEDWPNIHMSPEQTWQAATDLNTKSLMPVHWGKFVLAMHPWKEPIERLLKAINSNHINLITPMIGTPVNFHQPDLQTTQWWAALT